MSTLPPEILDLILSHLDRDSLLDASVASRLLRAISLPFLFSRFVFRPYTVGQWPNNEYVLPVPHKVQLGLERLRFWSSERIASLVRTCDVRPYPGLEQVNGSANLPLNWGDQSAAPDVRMSSTVLLDALFETLPVFRGLTRLQLSTVQIDDTMLATISRLPSLEALKTDSRVSLATIGGSEDQLIALFELEINPGLAVENWLRLFKRDTLHKLTATILDGPLPTIPRFSNLQYLSLRLYSYMAHTQLPPLLANFPTIETLALEEFNSLIHWAPGAVAVDPSIVPRLGTLRISTYMLPLVFPRLSVRRLDIPVCAWALFVEFLGSSVTPDTNAVTSLSIAGSGLADASPIAAVCKAFPHLVHLSISEDAPAEAAEILRGLSEIVSTAFPPSLQSLVLRWDEPPIHPLQTIDRALMQPLLTVLRHRCPALTSVWIECEDGFLYRWRKRKTRTALDIIVEDLITDPELVAEFGQRHHPEHTRDAD
uniref:F-box domain-containing protein n=1 Tax=Mycena chlorophos TaxID=658473 RepID=A0ABQ0LZC0_MYCCL|nr:predicted protein [Mycena chlorophos]